MILGIIPARAGSQRIQNKNILKINNKELIWYALESGNTSLLDDLIIDTNDKYIIDKYTKECKVFVRPDNLAKPKTSIVDTLKNTVNKYESLHKKDVNHICLLQITSPQRTQKNVDESIKLYKYYTKVNPVSNTFKYLSLYSGYYLDVKSKDNLHTSYDSNKFFYRNGAIFIFQRELLYHDKLWDENVIEFEMNKYESIDINEKIDYDIVKVLMEKGVKYE